jgi:UDP-GlcNAc3NAcA epimerase
MAMIDKAIAGVDGMQHVIVHTGQHYDPDMSDTFFHEMDIPNPDVNLHVNRMEPWAMFGEQLTKLQGTLGELKPDVVVVYGDTVSTAAGALAAHTLNLGLAHVEAGLRSHNLTMMEETNRILADTLADFLFTPTPNATKNLNALPTIRNRIICTGDVMCDAYRFYVQRLAEVSKDLQVSHEKMILCTIHRPENVNSEQRLSGIVDGLNKIVAEGYNVVFPMHPRTEYAIRKFGLTLNANVFNPVGYLEMLALLNWCELVVTDSGGLQKDAYFAERGCLTIRDETEWTELVDAEINWLSLSDGKSIRDNCLELLDAKLIFPECLYGSGHAATMIVDELLR